jgi:uncharacterized membrane protein YphA (DoxX/SURF4 family)
MDLMSIVAAAFLLVGLLTPYVAPAIAVTTVLSWRVWLLEDCTGLNAFLMVTACVAIAILGPGARSMDARLFGRREILIPGNSTKR